MQSTNVSFRLVDPKTEMRDTKSKLELKIKAPMQLDARKFHFQLFRGNQVTREKKWENKKIVKISIEMETTISTNFFLFKLLSDSFFLSNEESSTYFSTSGTDPFF